jgi:hypothetical protein
MSRGSSCFVCCSLRDMPALGYPNGVCHRMGWRSNKIPSKLAVDHCSCFDGFYAKTLSYLHMRALLPVQYCRRRLRLSWTTTHNLNIADAIRRLPEACKVQDGKRISPDPGSRNKQVPLFVSLYAKLSQNLLRHLCFCTAEPRLYALNYRLCFCLATSLVQQASSRT